jgi:hypothetical protein
MAPAVLVTPRGPAHKESLMDTSSVAYVLCRVEDDYSLTLISEHDDLLAGMQAGKHMVEVEDFDFSYSLYTVDLVARVARFAHGRAGYREWARRCGYIHSIDDRYDHDVDELMP